MSDLFESNIHHLLVELQRVDALTRQYVTRVRAGWQNADYQGLFISEEEIEGLLINPVLSVDQRREQESHPIDQSIMEQRQAIDRRVKASVEAGISLRLPQLINLFDLKSIQVDALLICLAIELDLRYERIYAYAQDDVTKKQPRVDLILNVLCPYLPDRLEARNIFLPTAPLLRFGLLELTDEPGQSYTPLLGRFVHIQRRILDYLLGIDEIDERLMAYATCFAPQTNLGDLTLPQDALEKLNGTLRRWQKENGDDNQRVGETLYLQGQYGSGRQAVARAISNQMGQNLLSVDVDRSISQAETDIAIIFREALLQNAVLLFRSFDSCLKNDNVISVYRASLLREMQHHKGLVILSGNEEWEPRGKLGERLYLHLAFATPDYATRTDLWKQKLGEITRQKEHIKEKIEPLANKFAFTPGQIHDSVIAARGLAAWQSLEKPLTIDQLYAAARKQSTPILNTMARKIVPRFGWSDIILIPDSLEILHEISSTIKNRHVVLGQWGFQRKLASGLGLNVLFAGESGTGKTMAADILAGELGLDLYKIDLSGLVSKYIGETEKNLDRIFREAKTSNAILFFDEADSIFGKRSEVRDSHDRYANIEISYLLQKMEDYDGIVILATNLRSNIDEAFVRRMHFVVDFPIPEAEYRLEIWRVHFPPDAPQGDDLDLPFLAKRFKITGGNIRNIVLGAAYLAADDHECIRMKHLVRAARRELQKMGRLVRELDFGQYYQYIDGGDGHAKKALPETG